MRLVLIVLMFLLGVSINASRAAENAALRLGIMPFNSTLALFKTHQPLRLYLQNKLGRPVEMYTAPDYAGFLRDSQSGQFDLLITGPHFGVMALENGYQPLFHYKAVLQPVIVVKTDSVIKGINDLKGKRVGLSSKLSISSIGGIKWLQEHGLRVGREYLLVEQSTHGAAVAAVAVGTLDAALTTHTPLKQIPDDVRKKVRILPTDIRTPHLMTLAHERLGTAEISRLKLLLIEFQQSPEGKAFFAETGYQGYTPITSQDIKTMRPFIELTNKLLSVKNP